MEAMVFTEADKFVEEAKNSRSMDVIYYPDIIMSITETGHCRLCAGVQTAFLKAFPHDSQ